MSIVVVVKKDNDIVIASDSLTSQGSLLIDSKYKINNEKFIKYKDNWIGCVSDTMSTQMLLHALENSEEEFSFDGVDAIYTSMLKLHKILKKKYYLSPKKKVEQNQTVESTNIQLLIANSSGIYGVGVDKNIEKFSKFWASGTAGALALGAMFYVYDKYDAKEIAKKAIETACEFDEGCALPIQIQTMKEEICQS